MFRTVICSLARFSSVSPNVRASSAAIRSISTFPNSEFQYEWQQRHLQTLSISIRNYAKKSKGSDGKAQTKKPKVELSKEELNSVIDFDGMCDSMKQSVAMLKEDYSKNLNLRLSQNSIESIQVKTSEGVFQLGELGQVMQKTSNSFVVDMISSPQHIKIAMEAIAKSSLKLNPQLDKTSILIQIPKLSREHRENLSKSAKKYFEDTLSKLRDIHNKNVKKISSAKNVSADLIFSLKETVKFQFDNYVKEAETMMKAKQNELLASDDK